MNAETVAKISLRPLNVLIVEDNLDDAELNVRELKRGGFEPRVEVVQTSHEFCALLATRNYHVILADYNLSGWNGLNALELLQQMEKEIPFVLVSGALDEGAVMECLQKGVMDHVPKNQLASLSTVVRRVVELKSLRDERVQLESKWREAEKRYQNLAELSADSLFIQSNQKLVFVNEAGARMLGAEHPRQLLDKNPISIIHPDSRADFEQHLRKLQLRPEAVSFDAKLVRLDGKAMDVRIAASALTYQDQPAVQWMGRDVTERKRVEEAIKSLASFAQLNPNPVLEFSRDGKLTYYNAAASEIAQSLGKDQPGAMLPPAHVSIVQMCLATGQKKLRLETTVGGRTFSWSFYPIKENQVVHCYVGDITERQSLEAQLRHSQKLESVGRLAAGVAHDFSNILTVIQGHAGLLKSDSNLSHEMGESLQQVSRAAERASKLIGHLLTFSRKNIIQPQRIDLNELLTNFSSMLQRTLGEDITFQFNYATDLPAIFADLGMIEQVVMNLAVNSRDAMPRGGQLVISTASANIDQVHSERYPEARVGKFVCLSVIDSGCGMDHVTLSRLFEPFFTTKEFGKGTGLGLATVYGIVKRHEGWIEVQSQIGGGTTFKIYLPPDKSISEETVPKPPGAAPKGGTETILVVEDEAPVRWIVKNILQRKGYHVLEAASGVEALAVWHQHHQDIILLLTDMVMPVGLSGQELAEKFKSQKPDLKVVYTSGYSAEIAGKDLTSMAGVSFLEKPFDPLRLVEAVRQCLDS